MSTKNIPTRSITIGALLQAGRFVIPDSQREYSWGPKEVTELCDDLFEHMNAAAKHNVFYRFNMASWYRDGDEISVFDGQQRITTLLLLHAAVLHLVNTASNDPAFAQLTDAERDRLKQVAAMLHNVVRVPSFTSAPTPRLTDQFPSSNAELAAIDSFVLSGTGALIDGAYTTAFRVIVEWFEQRFGGSAPMRAFSAIEYIGFVSEWGLITVDEVESEQAGWAAFNRANNRGKALTEQDRLKHLLWGNTAEAQRKEMSKRWNDTVRHARQKDLDLDESIAAVFTARYGQMNRLNLSPKEIYTAVQPHGPAHHDAADGITLTNVIAEGTRNYSSLRTYHGPHGFAPALEVLGTLYDGIPKQLFPLLLAGWHMDATSFDHFSTELLTCFVLHTEAIGRPQEFTASRARLLPLIRAWDAEKPASITALSEEFARFRQARAEAWGAFFSTFSLVTPRADANGELHLRHNVKRERVARFLLGIIQDALHAEATSTVPSLVGFRNRYFSTNASKAATSLEHILPQTVDSVIADQHFNGPDAAERLAHMFGNLTWLTSDENTNASNLAYLQKIPHYGTYDLARLVHTPTANPTKSQLASMLRAHGTWNTQAIYDRQEDLFRLVSRLMHIPTTPIKVVIPEATENKLGYRLVQADSPEKLIALSREIAAGSSKAKLLKLMHTMGLESERQLSYYRSALVELGVVVQTTPRKLALAPHFNGIIPTQEQFAQILLAHPATIAIDQLGEDAFTSCVLTDSGYDETTAKRRAASHIALYSWARATVNQEELGIQHSPV